jgi:hypothetical protein
MVADTASRPDSAAIESLSPVRAISRLHTLVIAVPTTPANTSSPPVRLRPTTRPCLLAWVPRGTCTCSRRTRSHDSTQSPAAHTPGCPGSAIDGSVRIPPESPSGSRASRASSLRGRTPMPMTTTWAG